MDKINLNCQKRVMIYFFKKTSKPYKYNYYHYETKSYTKLVL